MFCVCFLLEGGGGSGFRFGVLGFGFGAGGRGGLLRLSGLVGWFFVVGLGCYLGTLTWGTL